MLLQGKLKYTQVFAVNLLTLCQMLRLLVQSHHSKYLDFKDLEGYKSAKDSNVEKMERVSLFYKVHTTSKEEKYTHLVFSTVCSAM